MYLPKLLVNSMVKLFFIALAAWTAWLFSPIGPSNPPEKSLWVFRGFCLVMTLSAILFLALYLQWLRRVVLVYRLQELISEHGQNGMFRFETPDGTMCTLSANGDDAFVTLGGQLSSFVYMISLDGMFSLHRETEIWLDEVNSEYGPALRWFEVQSTLPRAVNERRIAKKIFQIIKDRPHS